MTTKSEPKRQYIPPCGVMYRFQDETRNAAKKLQVGVVQTQSHDIGITDNEPLIVMMDSLIRYAKAFKARYEMPLCQDGSLGEHWLDAAKAVRGLLNGDGAVALEQNRSTDSKDNGAMEDMFWAAMKIAGYKEADL